MDKVFIFDVDGTLTPSRRRMTEDFARFFDEWSSKNTFYLVSGSDLDKIKEQVPIAYLDRAKGIFTCGGNKFYINNKLEYEKTFKPPETLLTYLGFQIKISDSPVMSTNHREDRGAMLNFSVVGRDCTLYERLKYFEWDSAHGEREKIANEIKRRWPELDAVIGGQISIDIYPKGMDKSQILDVIKQERLVQPDEYIFIGDRTMRGGNDYPLAKLMEKTDNCSYHQTENWEQTMQILKDLND
jgi:phosphomannomutase